MLSMVSYDPHGDTVMAVLENRNHQNIAGKPHTTTLHYNDSNVSVGLGQENRPWSSACSPSLKIGRDACNQALDV